MKKSDPKPPTLKLLKWYAENYRQLPWRESRDPYRIWISEVMLQQTTVTAVIPYFEKFIKNFPTVQSLAKASIEKVYENWAGLGYYSRARNLHESAKQITSKGFPQTFEKLMELKGFGPYTARAVASFAFSQNVGVLDGNVIRFMSRFGGLALEWWRSSERAKLQTLADQWVLGFDSHDVNQALIEIGATICTAQSPKCLSCPVMSECQSVGTQNVELLPLKKSKKKNEFWIWNIEVYQKQNDFALMLNKKSKNSLPVLKNSWIWPGTAKQVRSAPQKFDFKHSVTHHSIYVQISKKRSNIDSRKEDVQWLAKSEIKKVSPFSLINKVLDYL